MTEESSALVEAKRSLVKTMADHYGMEPAAFLSTLKNTIMPNNKATNEQVAAFLVVANQHNLNPFTAEIFAFPSRGGGIQPVVSIDGWVKLINASPQLDGIEFEDGIAEDGHLYAVTCRIFRKDRSRPTVVTEYMSECHRDTEPWKKWPARMLRHKALIQCARYAFGFAGLVDPDEADRMREVGVIIEPSTQAQELKSRLEKAAAILDAEVVSVEEEEPEQTKEPEPPPQPEHTPTIELDEEPEEDPEIDLVIREGMEQLITPTQTAKPSNFVSAWNTLQARAEGLMDYHEWYELAIRAIGGAGCSNVDELSKDAKGRAAVIEELHHQLSAIEVEVEKEAEEEAKVS